MVNHEGLSKLKDLKELLDIGALTEEEFAEQKKLILNELSGGTSNVSSSKREAVQGPHVISSSKREAVQGPHVIYMRTLNCFSLR